MARGYEYNSGSNDRFLNTDEIRIFNKLADESTSFNMSDIEAGKFNDRLS